MGIPRNQKVYDVDVLAVLPWGRVSWRDGTKGKLAATRIHVGDGPVFGNNRHLPGQEAWLVGEWRSSDEREYYLSNLLPDLRARSGRGD